MVPLSTRELFGYGARLFGYLLVTTVLGGALIAGGIGAMLTLEPAALPGGEPPGSYAPVAAGGLLALLGLLVIVSGLLVTVFVMVADAVSVGIDTSTFGPETAADTADSESDETAPAPDGPETDDPLGDDTSPEPAETSDPLEARGSDPFADVDDPETSDPLASQPPDQAERVGASDDAASERRQAGPTREDDDQAWRREIEAKLDDDGRPEESPE